MGLVSTALQIGKSALMSYQSALQVIGNNISNAGSAEYTRQSPVLTPQMGAVTSEGFQAGAGVALTALKRNIDEALENRIRTGTSDQGSSSAAQQALGRLEVVLNEMSDNDLSTLIGNFFGAFSSLQNNPQDVSARGVVLSAGQSLVDEIQRQRTDVLSLVKETNQEIVDSVRQANQIVDEVAQLNQQIVEAESRQRGMASALRDQRDAKLRDLSGIVEIHVVPQETGAVNVYVGNELLVQGAISRGLTTETEISDGIERAIPEFADDSGVLPIRGGKVEGLIEARDNYSLGHLNDLDTLAAALIQEVNKAHAQGQGLEGMTDATGTYGVLDADAALNSDTAGLDLKPANGTFQITVRNTTTGTGVVTTIPVDLDGIGADTTLTSLVAAVNANTADKRLRITADDGYEFTFGEDSSNVLAALGVNTFFTGKAANDISINPVLSADPTLLAAARSNLPGDGTNADAIARVGRAAATSLGGRSIVDFYNTVAGKIAVNANAARASQAAADSIMTSLQAQRESISGVSLDEEAINLVRFERGFQGAARYVSVVDSLIDEMLALVK
jgi:flagellar hook-associated protein 1 FlgK